MEMMKMQPTIRFRAYANGHRCCLLNGAEHRVQLVDIGRDGARLRLEHTAAESLQLDEPCSLTSGIVLSGAALGALSCRVEWLAGNECGICFDEPCPAGVLELQQALAGAMPQDG